MTDGAIVLEAVGVRKRFGAALALDGAAMVVRRGRIHAVLGENGAGKTTLLRIVNGSLAMDDGTLRFPGARDPGATPRIGTVHQHSTLVPTLTAAENFALGTTSLWSPFVRRRSEQALRRVADAVGLSIDAEAVVQRLSVAARQRVEIARAIADDPAVLLLDEPTAVLPPAEARALYQWLRGYVIQGGTVVVVTHRLAEALTFADDITVLRRGRTVAAGARDAFTADSLLGAIVGDVAGGDGASVREPVPIAGEPVVVASGVFVSGRGVRVDLSFDRFALHPGEIVGVAGVEGAGQASLLRVLSGRLVPDRGRLVLPASGVGFIPEDRHAEGMIAHWSIPMNIALRGAGSRHGRHPAEEMRRTAASLIDAFDVRGASAGTVAGDLSGGNQQKLLVGRELVPRPDALVAENPFRGLDIRAAAAVRERLRDAAAAGTGVVVYSNDLDDLLGLVDRVVVCHAGAVLDAELRADAIGRLMTSGR